MIDISIVGLPGPTGYTGATGPQGPKGDPGESIRGEQGMLSLDNRSEYILSLLLKGHIGPMGPPGFPGPRGEMGVRGLPVSLIEPYSSFIENSYFPIGCLHMSSTSCTISTFRRPIIITIDTKFRQ